MRTLRTEHELYSLVGQLPVDRRRVFPAVYLNSFQDLRVNTSDGGFAVLVEDVTVQRCVEYLLVLSFIQDSLRSSHSH
jgi:hypothetical protein